MNYFGLTGVTLWISGTRPLSSPYVGGFDMSDIDLAKASDALTDERKTLIHQLEELGADESG